MPGLEDTLKAALVNDATVNALNEGRVYAGTIPPHDTPNYIYFTVPSEEPAEDLSGNDSDRWEVEIEIFAERYSDLRALKRAVRAVLNRYRGGWVRRCLWVSGDYTAVEGGHNWTERYTVWESPVDLGAAALVWGPTFLVWGP